MPKCIFSTRNNWVEYLAFYDVTFQNVIKSYIKTPVFGAPLPYLLSVASGRERNLLLWKPWTLLHQHWLKQRWKAHISHAYISCRVVWSNVYKIFREVLQFYPCKIKHVQELQRFCWKRIFGLQFLEQVEANEHRPQNILWTVQVQFYLNGEVEARYCRIWTKEIYPVLLHFPKFRLTWYDSQLHYWAIFFEEQMTAGPITGITISTRMIPELQNRGILGIKGFFS